VSVTVLKMLLISLLIQLNRLSTCTFFQYAKSTSLHMQRKAKLWPVKIFHAALLLSFQCSSLARESLIASWAVAKAYPLDPFVWGIFKLNANLIMFCSTVPLGKFSLNEKGGGWELIFFLIICSPQTHQDLSKFVTFRSL
jgi:hypothetical protein